MLEFHPFRLDVQNKCLWREGNRVTLTPKCFDLLAYLADRAGHLIPQAELIEKVWPNVFVQSDVLKTQIRDLRSCLGDDARSPRFIETVHRRGYRFIAETKDFNGRYRQNSGPSTPSPARDKERKRLRDMFQEACAGRPQLVFVKGEVGIGKTTLVNAFVDEISQERVEARILRGQCVEGFGAQEPYYPMLQAISGLIRSEEHVAVVEALARHAPTWLAQFPAMIQPEEREILKNALASATTQRMLRELCDLIHAISQEKPVVIVLEDVHWADPSTINSLTALARGNWSSKLIVIATYRPLDLVLLKSPLKNVKEELLARGLCDEIAVSPLTKDCIQRLIETRAPNHQPPRGLAEYLYAHSEGNPFLMESLLYHLESSDIVSLQSSGWVLRKQLSDLRGTVPGTLRKLLETHLDSGLSESERYLLEIASVCGVQFHAIVAAAVGGISQEQFESTCEAISNRGHFLRSLPTVELPNGSRSSSYEFTHSLYREVLYKRIPSIRRAELHSAIGHQLESIYQFASADIAAELVYHFEECHETQAVPKHLVSMGKSEASRFAFEDAIRSLRRANRLLSHVTGDEAHALEFDILSNLAAYHGALEDFEKAAEALEAAERSPVIAHKARTRAQILLQLAFARSREDVGQSLVASTRAWELAKDETDPFLRAECEFHVRFWQLRCDGRETESLHRCAAILTELERSPNRLTLAQCRLYYGLLLLDSSQYREGRQHIDSAIPTLTNDRDPFYRGTDRFAAYAHIMIGELGQALTMCRAGNANAAENDKGIREHLWSVMRAFALYHAMDFTGALELCERSIPVLHSFAAVAPLQMAMILRGGCEAHLGRLQQAREHLHQAAVLVSQRKTWICGLSTVFLYDVQAEWSLLACSTSSARKAAQRLLTISETIADRTWKAIALEANARVAIQEGKLSEASDFISGAMNLMKGFDLPLAHWRVHRTAIHLFPSDAERHCKEAKATIARLANSLEGFPELKQSFLSAAQFAPILEMKTDPSPAGVKPREFNPPKG